MDKNFILIKKMCSIDIGGETQKELTMQRIRCQGLVLGLNLPTIMHHYHHCRSYIVYLPPVAKQEKTEYNNELIKIYPNGFDINKIDKRIKAKIEELTNKYDSIQNPVQIRKSK